MSIKTASPPISSHTMYRKLHRANKIINQVLYRQHCEDCSERGTRGGRGLQNTELSNVHKYQNPDVESIATATLRYSKNGKVHKETSPAVCPPISGFPKGRIR